MTIKQLKQALAKVPPDMDDALIVVKYLKGDIHFVEPAGIVLVSNVGDGTLLIGGLSSTLKMLFFMFFNKNNKINKKSQEFFLAF